MLIRWPPDQWPMLLSRMEREQGPEDEFDDELNGDPDSLVGEEDEEGFEEMADWPEEAGLEGDFDPPEGDDDEDGEDGEEEDEC